MHNTIKMDGTMNASSDAMLLQAIVLASVILIAYLALKFYNSKELDA